MPKADGLRKLGLLGADSAKQSQRARLTSAALRESHDQEILDVLPPFLAFRALVIAHPLWYPELSEPLRVALIHFARRMMVDSQFDPGDVRELLETPR